MQLPVVQPVAQLVAQPAPSTDLLGLDTAPAQPSQTFFDTMAVGDSSARAATNNFGAASPAGLLDMFDSPTPSSASNVSTLSPKAEENFSK